MQALNALIELGKLGKEGFYYFAYPEEIPALITYEFPKLAFETTLSLSNRCVTAFTDWIAPVQAGSGPSKIRILQEALAKEAGKLSLEATSWATGKDIKEITKGLQQAKEIDASAFKAVDLIGPAFFMGFCLNKGLSHLANAAHKFTLTQDMLINQSKLLETGFKVPSFTSNSKAVFGKTKQYELSGLAKDTIMESMITLLYSAGVGFSYGSIYNVVLKASNNNAAQASYVAGMILAAGFVVPILCSVAVDLYKGPSNTSYKASKIAPHLVYTNPPAAPQYDDYREARLTLAQKVEYLEEQRKSALKVKGG